MAHARLSAELRSIARDVLGSCEATGLPDDVARWADCAAQAAVSAACDRALEALLASLQSTVAEAPTSVVARLERAVLQHDAGLD
jgi:hypothetical protein